MAKILTSKITGEIQTLEAWKADHAECVAQGDERSFEEWAGGMLEEAEKYELEESPEFSVVVCNAGIKTVAECLAHQYCGEDAYVIFKNMDKTACFMTDEVKEALDEMAMKSCESGDVKKIKEVVELAFDGATASTDPDQDFYGQIVGEIITN